jgi:tRNA pseudouridine38-40 synthase
MTTRYRLVIEYDGAGFHGWQRQRNGLSVQQVVEEAIVRFCGESVTVHAAGRTDAGVHARGQVVHVDLANAPEPRTVMNAVNFHVRPHPVAIVSAEAAPPDFHARFSATARTYRYRILNRPAPPVLDRGDTWWVPAPLDVSAMRIGALALIGRHDFTTFRASQCQARSPVRTLDRLSVDRDGEIVTILARARSFLHNQVRSMVGTVKRVGEGAWSPEDVADALAARDRTRAGPTAPAAGLTLMSVSYETSFPRAGTNEAVDVARVTPAEDDEPPV